MEWGRYDVVGKHTIYGARPPAASYAETLAWARVDKNLSESKLSTYFDTDGNDPEPATVLAATQEEIGNGGAIMAFGSVPAVWRNGRLIHEIQLPATGWFVDIQHSESIKILRRVLRENRIAPGVQRLTVEHLASENRRITTRIAEWIHSQSLSDGALAHGIYYTSKHGADFACWAVWLRQLDIEQARLEPTTAKAGLVIKAPAQNPPLQRAADLLGLTVH